MQLFNTGHAAAHFGRDAGRLRAAGRAPMVVGASVNFHYHQPASDAPEEQRPPPHAQPWWAGLLQVCVAGAVGWGAAAWNARQAHRAELAPTPEPASESPPSLRAGEAEAEAAQAVQDSDEEEEAVRAAAIRAARAAAIRAAAANAAEARAAAGSSVSVATLEAECTALRAVAKEAHAERRRVAREAEHLERAARAAADAAHDADAALWDAERALAEASEKLASADGGAAEGSLPSPAGAEVPEQLVFASSAAGPEPGTPSYIG